MLTAKRLHRLAMVFALTGALCLFAVAQKNTAVPQFNLSSRQMLPFESVQIQDSFWTSKQKIYRDNTIPYWDISHESNTKSSPLSKCQK